MIQALHAILGSVAEAQESGTEEPKIKVTMLYGSRSSDDILGKEILDHWAEKYPNFFECVFVLSHEPTDSSWTGPRGFINQELIEKHFPNAKDDNIQLFICGPPPMYDFFSGPRTEPEVKGLFGQLGYRSDQVYKF
jgi:cytochrome-b5 reductase